MKTIKVRQKHIEAGERRDYDSCPIALAVLEQTRETVSVGRGAICIGGIPYVMPREAREFVDRFDDGKTVKPFSFKPLDK